MPILVKAILICMTVTSVNGAAPVNGVTKCVPIEENLTNAINGEALEEYDTVRALFFTPVEVEDNLVHGNVILGAEIISTTADAQNE